MGIVLLTGALIWFYEKNDPVAEDFYGKPGALGVRTGVKLAAETFTGMASFNPDTAAGQIAVWSLSLVMVIVLAA